MSGPPATVLAIPEPLDTDDDDVSLALHTAGVQWRRGDREDAIAWLRRGADSAVDAGHWERASQLNVIATQLEKDLTGSAPPEPDAPLSVPRFPSRAPTPASHSFVPQSVRGGPPSAPMPVATPSRFGPPSASLPLAAPSFQAAASSIPVPLAPSTPAHSPWPSGFPPSAAQGSSSGRAAAPPPPLPPGYGSGKAAPIPPAPPRSRTPSPVRRPHFTAPEIQVGMEELDMTDAELVEYAEDVTFRGQAAPEGVSNSEMPSSAPISLNSLPAYDLDEDPMDGTSALPESAEFNEPYASESIAPDSVGEGLPAFPLEDSIPAGPPSARPQPSFPSSPPPVPLRSSVPAKPPVSSKVPSARPSSRPEAVESSRRDSGSSRSVSPSSQRPVSERPAYLGRNLPSPIPLHSMSEVTTEPPRSSQAPSNSTEDLSSSPLTMLSMDDLEAVSLPPDDDENTTSVPPPISSSRLEHAAPHPFLESKPPPSLPKPASASASDAPTMLSSIAQRAESAPPPSVRGQRPSVRPPSVAPPPSQAPVHLDRETPIPSSFSGPKAIALHGIELASVRGLCDLPEESHRMLRQRARIERMGTGEDLSFFSVVLVLEGWVKLMPAIADVTCATAAAGEVVFTQGSLSDGVALRVVAGQNGTTLATWDRETFEEITQSCPWVADELRLIADSFQALAGTALGMLGERLDDALREVVTSKCQVLTLLPGEVLVQQGKPVPGMHIVGAGLIELLDSSGAIVSTVAPGDFLLTDQVLAGGVSPHTVRASTGGALILFAPRMIAHELLVSVPPLLEILAG